MAKKTVTEPRPDPVPDPTEKSVPFDLQLTKDQREALERIERRLTILRDYACDQQDDCVYECLGSFEFLGDSLEAIRKDLEKLIYAEEEDEKEPTLIDAAATEGGAQ
jgi:hypothetical protein